MMNTKILWLIYNINYERIEQYFANEKNAIEYVEKYGNDGSRYGTGYDYLIIPLECEIIEGELQIKCVSKKETDEQKEKEFEDAFTAIFLGGKLRK